MTGCRSRSRRLSALACAMLLSLSACDTTSAPPTQVQVAQDSLADVQYAISAAANTIRNPGFETPGAGVDPANWSRNWWGSPAPAYSYPVTGRTSPRAARIRYSASSSGGARWQADAVTVTPGTTWDYSEWYRTTTGTSVVVEYTSTTGALSYALVRSVPSSANVWTELQATLVIPAGVTRASVFHLITTTGTLVIDDVAFAPQGGTPPPQPPPPTGAFSEGMVTLSLDDSWQSQYVNALPVLQAAGMKATFYLTTTPVEQGWQTFMTPAQVRDISAKGHEIAGHTLSHPDLTTQSQAAIDTELQQSRTYLGNLTGAAVTTFAYPYGRRNSLVKSRVAPAGYTSARSVDLPGLNDATADRYDLRSQTVLATDALTDVTSQVDLAIVRKQWLILTVHEVNVGGDLYFITPARFQAIVDYIRQSRVRVVTIAEGAALLAR